MRKTAKQTAVWLVTCHHFLFLKILQPHFKIRNFKHLNICLLSRIPQIAKSETAVIDERNETFSFTEIKLKITIFLKKKLSFKISLSHKRAYQCK